MKNNHEELLKLLYSSPTVSKRKLKSTLKLEVEIGCFHQQPIQVDKDFKVTTFTGLTDNNIAYFWIESDCLVR